MRDSRIISTLMPTTKPSNVVEAKAGKCPCGCTTFERAITASGIWRQTVTLNHDASKAFIGESNIDGIAFRRQPKYMRCTGCKRRVYNPDFAG